MSNMITFTTKPCMVCEKTTALELDTELVRRWQAGSFVQDVWPEMPKEQRELLITGTHAVCWDDMFGEGDE